jgi:type IV pilus assembly protein PilQ
MKTMRVVLVAVTIGLSATLTTAGAQQPQTGAGADQGLRRFSGDPIDVNYQSANLRTVLLSLAEIGRINLVIDPSVPTGAAVDLRLTQVPWDQVMDVVLKSAQLTYEVEGPVLRVLTREAYTREKQAEAQQRTATRKASDLETVRLRLNYAVAADVKRLLETARLVSDEGTVDIDERTNMLIIKDVPTQLQEIAATIADIDKPEPQVEIEAQIVQINRNSARDLGVQWGINGRMAQELGNATGAGFPNTGSVTGGVTLPATGASSSVGLSLGSINGALSLDVALSALEREGKARILSTPRVVTQNNKQAEMTQGFQIPIQTQANQTVSVQFKDAALKLLVTPQITAANTVILKIVLENGQPDFSRAVNGNPSISTQRAETSVQVPDGVTTIIGGILQTEERSTDERTPGASRIPILGWLFRNSSNADSRQELLISITPRIIRGQP